MAEHQEPQQRPEDGDGTSLPTLCLEVHPLAGVTCTELRGHEGPHGTISGVKMTWYSPDDPRARKR